MKVFLDTREVAIFNKLIAGLSEGKATKFDNAKGIFMAVHVEHIGVVPFITEEGITNLFDHYSIAQYGTQNGDAMRDPDVTFLVNRKDKDCIIPVSYRNDYLGIDNEYWETKKDGKLYLKVFMIDDTVKYCKNWFRDIKNQQGL